MHTQFLQEKIRKRNHLGDLDIDERIFQWILKEEAVRISIRLIWLRMESTGGLL
jgi:hypothetical protein